MFGSCLGYSRNKTNTLSIDAFFKTLQHCHRHLKALQNCCHCPRDPQGSSSAPSRPSRSFDSVFKAFKVCTYTFDSLLACGGQTVFKKQTLTMLFFSEAPLPTTKAALPPRAAWLPLRAFFWYKLDPKLKLF